MQKNKSLTTFTIVHLWRLPIKILFSFKNSSTNLLSVGDWGVCGFVSGLVDVTGNRLGPHHRVAPAAVNRFNCESEMR